MADVPPPLPYAGRPVLDVVPASDAALISPEDVPRQLAAAHAAWRPIGRAARYATFDAWTLAACGVLSLPCMGVDATGVAVAVLLCAVAAVEFRGVARLRKLDPAAPGLLAINQLALTGGILLYCAWNLYLVSLNRGLMGVLLAQGLGQAPDAVALVRQVCYGLYAGLAVIGPVTTGAAAWFYTTRTPRLRAYLAKTPAWIVQMQRDRGTL